MNNRSFVQMYPPGTMDEPNYYDIPLDDLYAIRDPECVDDPIRNLDESLTREGQKEALSVACWREHANLEDGHHRLLSALRLGWATLRTGVWA